MRRILIFQREQHWCFARDDGSETVSATPLMAALEAQTYAETFRGRNFGYIIRLQTADPSAADIPLHSLIF